MSGTLKQSTARVYGVFAKCRTGVLIWQDKLQLTRYIIIGQDDTYILKGLRVQILIFEFHNN